MGRATLAPREGMIAAVPPLRERPLANMKDMGMDMAGMAGMAGMDHNKGMPADMTQRQQMMTEHMAMMQMMMDMMAQRMPASPPAQ